MKENIIINYLLLEQILRITGTYKTVCDEYENLSGIYTKKNKEFDADKYEKDKEKFEKDKEKYKDDKEKCKEITENYNKVEKKNRKYIIHKFNILVELFKRSREGEIDSLFQDDEAKDVFLKRIENLTGVSDKYWSGQKRIKLGIRCNNSSLIVNTTKSIDKINLSNDNGTMYVEVMNNPLSLNHDEVYLSAVGKYKEEVDSEVMDQETDILGDLYSLKSLITILLINMQDAEIVELIDKANIYKHKKWKDYMRELKEPTKEGITYVPKYVEIRRGLVQTIIKNLLGLGYVFTFRDLEKEINI